MQCLSWFTALSNLHLAQTLTSQVRSDNIHYSYMTGWGDTPCGNNSGGCKASNVLLYLRSAVIFNFGLLFTNSPTKCVRCLSVPCTLLYRELDGNQRLSLWSMASLVFARQWICPFVYPWSQIFLSAFQFKRQTLWLLEQLCRVLLITNIGELHSVLFHSVVKVKDMPVKYSQEQTVLCYKHPSYKPVV